MPVLQKSLRLLLRCLLLLGVVIGVSAPAGQVIAATATDRDAFASSFRDTISDPVLYDALIEGMQIGPAKAPLLCRYFEDVMTDPAMKTGFSLGYEVALSITTRGPAKMGHDDIHSFFALMSTVFSQIEPRYCRVLMQQQGAPQEAQIMADFAVMRSLDMQQFRRYLSLPKPAIAAELSPALPRALPTRIL